MPTGMGARSWSFPQRIEPETQSAIDRETEQAKTVIRQEVERLLGEVEHATKLRRKTIDYTIATLRKILNSLD